MWLVGFRIVLELIARQPLERDVQRADAEKRDECHAAKAGAVHDAESHVLGRLRVELHGFPNQRVVTAKAVTPDSNLAAGALTKQQRSERLAVERQHDLPCLHIVWRRAFDGQSGGILSGRRHVLMQCGVSWCLNGA
jgi:hypothetical protein